jgi:cyclopropane fatty-acyl-phospholipid synthase-like methyltransferase
MSEVFDSDYYLRGKETGKSNYSNYRFLPEETGAYAMHLRNHLFLSPHDTICDFGCARGYLVRVLRNMRMKAIGYDISKWATENCEPSVREYIFNHFPCGLGFFDWIHAKDVMEHIQLTELGKIIAQLSERVKKGIFLIVPLADKNGKYIYPPDELDPTHQIRWTLDEWVRFLTKACPDFTVSGSYHMHSLKPASVTHPYSTGFFTIKRYMP